MEKKVRQLFDFQKFQGDQELQSVIGSVHARYTAQLLDEDDLDFVAAAGAPEANHKRPGNDEGIH